MAAISKNARVCETCGSPIETTSAGDLGCIACLIATGLDAEAEQSDTACASVPHQLGGYTIERHPDGSAWELGHGAMGVTYRAIDKALDRPVALKIINTDRGSHSAEARERFMREARAAAALRHPNVATVYQFGVREETGQFFYAMELVEGETLEERVRRLGPLDVLTTIDIALQVTAALQAAEERRLVHRDLKPGNLMLVGGDGEEVERARPPVRTLRLAGRRRKETPQRGVPTVKVIDFGVAKAISEKTDAMKLTHGGFVGTPVFASPEQFTDAPVDVRSDIYSLGATLWFLMTGQVLFSGHTIEEIREARRSKPLPIEQLKAACVPQRFVSLLRSMLATEPVARPTGARELAAKLQAIRDSITGRRKIAVRLALAAALIAVATVVGIRAFNSASGSASTIPEKSIAVLPFENLSRDPDNAYFATGIQDEILTRLAKISALKVISRKSTKHYESRPANLAQIGKELGVASILEGSVQKVGETIRVNVHLIKASTNAHLWAESYDRELTDVFAVEADVASRIANSLKATLTPDEKQRVNAIPTMNPDAYEAYLQGREMRIAPSSYLPEYDAKEREHYEYAIALDPEFALAHAALSFWYSMEALGNGVTPENRTKSRSEADEALRLQPDLGEAHKALGRYYYSVERDYDAASKEYAIALRALPNDSELIELMSYLQKRRNHWRAAIAGMQRAVSLDPRNDRAIRQLTGLYRAVRDYAAAEETKRREVDVAGSFSVERAVLSKAELTVLQWIRTGNVAPMQSLYDDLPNDFDPDLRGGILQNIAFAKRDPDLMIEGVRLAGDKQDLTQFFFVAQPMLVKGDVTRANEILDGLISSAEADVKKNPAEAQFHSKLGMFYGFRGRNEEAIREGVRGVELLPENKDAAGGPILESFLARTYARVGEVDRAIDLIEHLLTIPCEGDAAMSKRELQVDWGWDPLRQNPRFQKLLASPDPKTIYN